MEHWSRLLLNPRLRFVLYPVFLKKNCIQDIHFLQIDTEGYDYEILKTLDFANQSPVMIIIEHIHLSNAHKTEMVNLLRKYSYSIHYCGIDLFALNKEAYKGL